MNARGRSVEGGKYGAYGGGEGLSSVLTREQDRALRAKAWRHVRRINPAVARRVWRNHRGPKLMLPKRPDQILADIQRVLQVMGFGP